MRIISVVAIAAAIGFAGCASVPRPSAPGSAHTELCRATDVQEISALFDRWNRSLQTGDARLVTANYADGSVLLPTVSNRPRISAAEKEDYFVHFLENKPFGTIDSRTIELGCNSALDTGLYTFVFATTGERVEARFTYTYGWDGKQWLITSHHSSALPGKD